MTDAQLDAICGALEMIDRKVSALAKIVCDTARPGLYATTLKEIDEATYFLGLLRRELYPHWPWTPGEIERATREGHKLAELIQRHATEPPKINTACKVCGIKFDGPMGYVCPHPDCPTASRGT